LISAVRRAGIGVREILIVEDDPEMSRLLASLLGAYSSRYRIRLASDGEEALALLQSKRPDLVLLDLLIPEPNGHEILAKIRSDESLRNVPIVVVSAKGEHDETVGGGTLGISRSEGLTVGELMKCLQSSLDAMLSPAPPGSVPGQPATFVEIPASGENRTPPARELEVVLAGSSR
jgi:CheY-like chemotaxis protein